MVDSMSYEKRKESHIQWALDPASQAATTHALDRVHLVHEALPDLDLNAISIPAGTFYLSGMTAGHTQAEGINHRLAEACVRWGWALGIGSQRRDLVAPLSESTYENWKEFRDFFPSLELFANVGITQLQEIKIEKLLKVLSDMNAQALVVHTNPLQEAIQTEGTPNFMGALDALKELISSVKLPVVLKETGTGFSYNTLKRLSGLGLHAVDVSGKGGTHWGRVEGLRAGPATQSYSVSRTFAEWGESTLDSIQAFQKACFEGHLEQTELWASGGIRSGLDAAKCLALGASRVGYAQPAMKAALEGPERLDQWMQQQVQELKIALFCTGCGTVDRLRTTEGLWTIATT